MKIRSSEGRIFFIYNFTQNIKMQLKLNRPLAIFDLEATGINITKDRIVEIAILKIHPDGTEEKYLKKVNPEMVIPNEVIAIHGITNEDVANCPTFSDIAEEVNDFIKECDLGGFNSNKYDASRQGGFHHR